MELFAGRPQTPIPPPPRPEDVESIVPNLPLPPAPGTGRDKLPFLADDYDDSGDLGDVPASLELNDGSVADVQSLRNLFLQYLQNSPPRPESLPQTLPIPQPLLGKKTGPLTLGPNPNGLTLNSKTNIINQGDKPQIVIVPHTTPSSGPNGRLKLQIGPKVINLETGAVLDPRNAQVDLILPRPPVVRSGQLRLAGGANITEEERESLSRVAAFRGGDDGQPFPFSHDVISKDDIDDEEKDKFEERRQALLRASEKQELMLDNLMDAVKRNKELQKESQEEGEEVSEVLEMEMMVREQIAILSQMKGTVLNMQDDGEVQGEARISMLEDASHRQLEVLEILTDAMHAFEEARGETFDPEKPVLKNQLLAGLNHCKEQEERVSQMLRDKHGY